jgi:nitrogen fixation-related uncharacterized protein
MTEGSDILNKLKESSRELFTVPEGYFESFPEQMLEKAVAGEDTSHGSEQWLVKTPTTVAKAEPVAASVISLSAGKRMFRYMAAAVVAGIIGLGAWLWVIKPGTVDDNAISQADKDVIQKVQNISDSEMANYIENSALTATGEKTDIDIRGGYASLMLADIPDEDLQQYLEQHNGTKPLLN